jgi:hypothetical protein
MSPDFVPVTDSNNITKGKPLKLSGFPFKSGYRFETSAFFLNQSALVKSAFIFIEAMSITKRYFTSLCSYVRKLH